MTLDALPLTFKKPVANRRLKELEKKLIQNSGKAIHDYNMIEENDRVLVCLSGGKDSYTMASILNLHRIRSKNKFSIGYVTVDQGQPGWMDEKLKAYMAEQEIPGEVIHQDTYTIVKEKLPAGATYCSLCSRLRRGILYRYAKENGYTKIALGHHKDDLAESLLMSILYQGEISSMPPKLLTDCRNHIVIRPLVYCNESDIIEFSNEKKYPIIPCNLCGSQDGLVRQKIKKLIAKMREETPHITSNVLHALQSVRASQLMDHNIFDFKNLEDKRE